MLGCGRLLGRRLVNPGVGDYHRGPINKAMRHCEDCGEDLSQHWWHGAPWCKRYPVVSRFKKKAMSILLDPKIFNYLIMTLYLLNALRWAIAKKPADVCYWLSALAITATVTFLYDH